MKKGFIISIFYFAMVLAAFAACSKSSIFGSGTEIGSKISSKSIGNAKAEAEQLKAPGGVDEALFESLKQKFLDDLEARFEGRLVSQAGVQTPPLYLSKRVNLDDTTTLEWRYFNTGDYDLSGEVGVPDITPVALNYLARTDDGVKDNVQSFIDGDGDGEIGIPDVTPIALNYLNKYSVSIGFFDTEPSASWNMSQWQSNALFAVNAGVNPLGGGLLPLNVILNESDEHYGWVGHTFNNADIPQDAGTYYFGVRSSADPPLFVSFQEYIVTGEPGVAPVVESVTPQYGYPYQETSFNVVIAEGTEPLEFFWNLGGGAVPNTTFERNPAVTLYRAGSYNASVKVSNEYGSQTFDFELEISDAPKITTIHPLAGGFSGDEILFTATVGGQEPFEYLWEFGGGAEPDTSTEVSPAVVLGAAGDYSAKLTLTSPFGSDVYVWTLKVLSGAPRVGSVSPLTGVANSLIQMTATVDGVLPISYWWDFGSAAIPGNSPDSNPTITLSSIPGVYPCSLTVLNEKGTDEFDFEINVTEAPIPPEVVSVSPGGGQSGSSVQFEAVVTGTLPIIYTWNFGGAGTPNESNLLTPTITLGAAGTYNASLYVENSFGLGSDLYDFEITITPAPGQWTSEIVDYGGDFVVGANARLVFLPTGEPFIAYQAQSGPTSREVRTAKKVGGEWIFETVDDAGGGNTGYELDMVLDPNGYPTLGYQHQTGPSPDPQIFFDVKVAFYDGENWTIEIPDNDGDDRFQNGFSTTIAYASDGRCFIGHKKVLDLSTPHYARMGFRSLEGVWSPSTFTTWPLNMRVVLDDADVPVFLVRKDDGIWCFWGGSETLLVPGTDNGYWISMDKDLDGNPAATWYDFINKDLYFCKWNGSAWTTPEIVRSLGDVGVHSNLKYAPDGKPWVAYHNQSQGTLMISTKPTGNWNANTIDGGGGIAVGRYPSIAFNPAGKPCVAYLQNTNNNFALKFAVLN